MDVSPKTVREVEFREKMRGYNQEDVDQFLEQVAEGLEELHERLRQALERAQRAESSATANPAQSGLAYDPSSPTEETLRKTLILAQRTADMAVAEAREQASRILGGAEQQAQAVLGEAEGRARRAHDEALGEIRSELAALEGTRQRAQQEVDALARWAEDHRGHLTASLRDALAAVERAGLLSPPPSSRALDLPGGRRPAPPAPGPQHAPPPPVPQHAPAPPPVPASAPPAPAGPAGGPPPLPDGGKITVGDGAPTNGGWLPGAAPGGVAGREAPARRSPDDAPPRADEASGPNEQALDDFFEDGEYGDDHRFGGRLRRRR